MNECIMLKQKNYIKFSFIMIKPIVLFKGPKQLIGTTGILNSDEGDSRRRGVASMSGRELHLRYQGVCADKVYTVSSQRG